MRDDDVIGIVQVTSQMWDGTEDGNWGNPNWLLGGVGTPVVPEAGMAMVVDSGKVTVAATPTATPLSLGVATTGTVEIAPAATLALTETVTVGDGGRLNVNGLLTTGSADVVDIQAGGTLAFGGGGRVKSTLAANAAVTLTVSGVDATLAGGEGISYLGDFATDSFDTNLVVGADAVIDWMFNSSDETYIDVAGDLTIADGININISLADGSALPDGVDVKLILAYDAFNVVDLATYTVGLPTGWDSDGLATLVEGHVGYDGDVTYLILQNLTSGGVVSPVEGDANGDTNVDELDMAILLAQFGSPYDMAREPNNADFTGDGFVDLEDFVILRANWGEGTAPDASVLPNAAPEPATMTMLALGAMVALRRRRRKA